VSSYLTRVAQVKDELVAVGEVISDSVVVVLIHTYKRGEVSNPLGVSLEAQA
jgi:hypothetical protein